MYDPLTQGGLELWTSVPCWALKKQNFGAGCPDNSNVYGFMVKNVWKLSNVNCECPLCSCNSRFATNGLSPEFCTFHQPWFLQFHMIRLNFNTTKLHVKKFRECENFKYLNHKMVVGGNCVSEKVTCATAISVLDCFQNALECWIN